MNNKYLSAPWHSTRDELPEAGHNMCVCVCPYLGNGEYEMIFHRARKDSGYKDFFTCCGRSYDYDLIKYWRYLTDKEE
ncbi:MAG: hypothetical protein KBS70_08275 [Bacteroidales bacterium]|nr:hypothetical protein [Candidatus Colicola equi]